MNLESFNLLDDDETGGEASTESIEKVQERFAEKAKKTRQIKKDEKKKKDKDINLADIIFSFLNNKNNPELLSTTINLLKKGFDSQFLLSSFSLINDDIKNIVNERFDLVKYENIENNIKIPMDLENERKEKISQWMKDLWQIAIANTRKYKILIWSGEIIDPRFTHFIAIILQDFFIKNDIHARWSDTENFASNFTYSLGKKITEENDKLLN